MSEQLRIKCDYCGRDAKKVWGAEKYPHRKDLWHLKIWSCEPCDAYVGCHQDTWNPKGRLANKQLRKFKMDAHAVFDPCWKSGRYKRKEAYAKLAEKLGIPFEKCHIGMFDVDMCKRVIEVMNGIF